MRVIIWLFAMIVFVLSGLSSYGGDLYAQRSPTIPTFNNRDFQDIEAPEEPQSECSPDGTDQLPNSCEPLESVKIEVESAPGSSSPENPETDQSNEKITLLPNPEVQFVEEYMLNFDGQKSRDTIFLGGVVPFVAVPDTELSTDDRFFNDQSFSVFFYLKRKF